jgi:hypothetical protein
MGATALLSGTAPDSPNAEDVASTGEAPASPQSEPETNPNAPSRDGNTKKLRRPFDRHCGGGRRSWGEMSSAELSPSSLAAPAIVMIRPTACAIPNPTRIGFPAEALAGSAAQGPATGINKRKPTVSQFVQTEDPFKPPEERDINSNPTAAENP